MKTWLRAALLAFTLSSVVAHAAITEDDIIAVSGADASSTTLNLTATDTTGSTGAFLFICHEGASTTYTWSTLSGGSGGTFVNVATLESSTGSAANDLGGNLVFAYGFTGAASHIFRVTLGASRPFRYGAGAVLGGTFDSTFSAATAQSAQGDSSPTAVVDAGSLVTSAAAYLIQVACHYSGTTIMTPDTGWTVKSNATSGRHFQARNEASSGTFNPSFTAAGATLYVTLAGAAKEAAGGGGSAIAIKSTYHQQLQK